MVQNNHNYNLKGIIDNYDLCHNRAALTIIIIIIAFKLFGLVTETGLKLFFSERAPDLCI